MSSRIFIEIIGKNSDGTYKTKDGEYKIGTKTIINKGTNYKTTLKELMRQDDLNDEYYYKKILKKFEDKIKEDIIFDKIKPVKTPIKRKVDDSSPVKVKENVDKPFDTNISNKIFIEILGKNSDGTFRTVDGEYKIGTKTIVNRGKNYKATMKELMRQDDPTDEYHYKNLIKNFNKKMGSEIITEEDMTLKPTRYIDDYDLPVKKVEIVDKLHNILSIVELKNNEEDDRYKVDISHGKDHSQHILTISELKQRFPETWYDKINEFYDDEFSDYDSYKISDITNHFFTKNDEPIFDLKWQFRYKNSWRDYPSYYRRGITKNSKYRDVIKSSNGSDILIRYTTNLKQGPSKIKLQNWIKDPTKRISVRSSIPFVSCPEHLDSNMDILTFISRHLKKKKISTYIFKIYNECKRNNTNFQEKLKKEVELDDSCSEQKEVIDKFIDTMEWSNIFDIYDIEFDIKTIGRKESSKFGNFIFDKIDPSGKDDDKKTTQTDVIGLLTGIQFYNLYTTFNQDVNNFYKSDYVFNNFHEYTDKDEPMKMFDLVQEFIDRLDVIIDVMLLCGVKNYKNEYIVKAKGYKPDSVSFRSCLKKMDNIRKYLNDNNIQRYIDVFERYNDIEYAFFFLFKLFDKLDRDKYGIKISIIQFLDSFHDFIRISGGIANKLNELFKDNYKKYFVGIPNEETIYKDKDFSILRYYRDLILNTKIDRGNNKLIVQKDEINAREDEMNVKKTILQNTINLNPKDRQDLRLILWTITEKALLYGSFEKKFLYSYIIYYFFDKEDKIISASLPPSLSNFNIPLHINEFAKDVAPNTKLLTNLSKISTLTNIPSSLLDANPTNSSRDPSTYIPNLTKQKGDEEHIFDLTITPYNFTYNFSKGKDPQTNCELLVNSEPHYFSAVQNCLNVLNYIDTTKIGEEMKDKLDFCTEKQDYLSCMEKAEESTWIDDFKKSFSGNPFIDNLYYSNGYSGISVNDVAKIILLNKMNSIKKGTNINDLHLIDKAFTLKRLGDFGQVMNCHIERIPLLTIDHMEILMAIETNTSVIFYDIVGTYYYKQDSGFKMNDGSGFIERKKYDESIVQTIKQQFIRYISPKQSIQTSKHFISSRKHVIDTEIKDERTIDRRSEKEKVVDIFSKCDRYILTLGEGKKLTRGREDTISYLLRILQQYYLDIVYIQNMRRMYLLRDPNIVLKDDDKFQEFKQLVNDFVVPYAEIMKRIEILERYNSIIDKNDTNSLFYKIFTKYEIEDLLMYIRKKGRISALQNTLRLLLDDIDSECFVTDDKGNSVYSDVLCSFTKMDSNKIDKSSIEDSKNKLKVNERIQSRSPFRRIRHARKTSFQRSPTKQSISIRKSSFPRASIKNKKRSHFK